MLKFTCEVVNQKGMHARATARLVELVNGYEAAATLSHQDREAPADSMIKLLTLDAPKGSKITVQCHGKQANVLCTAIKELFAAGFGELS